MKNVSDILKFYDRSISIAAKRGQEVILRNARHIDRVMSLFSDEESQYLYAQEIIYCALCQILRQDIAPYFSGLMTNNEFINYVDGMRNHKLFKLFVSLKGEESEYIKAADMAATFLLEQYRYKNLVRVEEGDICIDGGAYIGDTALYFTEGKAQKVYSFEIDHGNLECLKTNMENFGKTNVVEIVEMALGRKRGTIPFIPMKGNTSGGRIAETSESFGAYDVFVTTIDAFCEERKIVPNFIKMDIEGAELDALEGARKTIEKYHPKLAVCIYHKWEHHWDIPLFLHEICPKYKLYLKKSQPYSETVLFATM